jgi:tRNA 2-thiouridine synthesizing protein B
MATLHLLSHSPFSDSRFASCLPLLGDADALLLTGDATYALQAGSEPCQALEQLSDQVALFALTEDVQARAISALPPRVQLLDYAAFVELTCRYERVNSWL